MNQPASTLSKSIYLDYHATTPTDPRVASLMLHYMTDEFGNASSTDHEWGDRAEEAVKQAAKQVADLVGASPREVIYPFKQRGLVKADILRLLEDSGIGLPKYYEWRSRSGCYFCFFQRKYEWVMLHETHPDLFAKAVQYESQHKDGRTYTWTQGETLLQLLERKDQIMADHHKAMARQAQQKPDRPLVEALEAILDEEDETLPCLACHL